MPLHISLIGRNDLSGEIYRQTRRAILAGRLRPGERLPPSREFARALAVSRMTVVVGMNGSPAKGSSSPALAREHS
jgi:GntR family transcriptional regulator/MocR family aminotransferase